MGKISKFFFIILLIILGVSFFAKGGYKKIKEIDGRLFKEPIQAELAAMESQTFTKDDYEYELEYLYDYEINGLVVNRMDYRWFSIYKRDSVFPIDLCMIWGDNVEGGIFRDESLHFYQDFRFCNWTYRGNLEVDNNQVANVHLLINNENIEKAASALSVGDQIKLKGKLVNVKAQNVGETGKYDPEYFELHSSTTRNDSGAGACEVLLVEDVEILDRGNKIFHILFKTSLYLLILFLLIKFIYFFIGFKDLYHKH